MAYNQKFCIFVSEAQNEQGILLAIWLALCVRMRFESANFVSSQKKAGQCVYFMKECGVFHDEFDPSSRDIVKWQLVHFISWLKTLVLKLKTWFSRRDSVLESLFWELRVKSWGLRWEWLSIFFLKCSQGLISFYPTWSSSFQKVNQCNLCLTRKHKDIFLTIKSN